MIAIKDAAGNIINIGPWNEELSGPLPEGALEVEITDQDLADLRDKADRPKKERDLEARLAALEERIRRLEVEKANKQELK